jgi:hypothetical protein
VPTRGSRPGGRATGPPLEIVGKHLGKFLVAHPGGLSLEAIHHPTLFAGEVVAVLGERAFQVLPRSPY